MKTTTNTKTIKKYTPSLATLALPAALLALVLAATPLRASVSPTPDDIDGDGIANIVDSDVDGDGIPNGIDHNVDGGVARSGPYRHHFVGDRLPNRNPFEKDIDGDGLDDDAFAEQDIDGDGLNDDSVDELDIKAVHVLPVKEG